jgi:hypothetical protein
MKGRRYFSEHKVWFISQREAVEHILIFLSDCVLIVKPITKGITNLTVQYQFVAIIPLIDIKFKPIEAREGSIQSSLSLSLYPFIIYQLKYIHHFSLESNKSIFLHSLLYLSDHFLCDL